MAWDDELDRASPAYAIATSEEDKIIVIAGPGTGKSFAMKRRIARLLEDGVQPGHILPVTFTNVAANDMHQELIGMSVTGAERLKALTLHSLAFTILSKNNVLTETGRKPRPLFEYELDPLMADLAEHGGKRRLKERIEAFNQSWQDMEVSDDENETDLAKFKSDLMSWLKFHKAMLLEEIIPEARNYLERNPAADERQEFKHILVDEFQDLNRVEQDFIKYLSGDAKVCIIGDDDQSIYSFKYANPMGLQDWMNENPQHVRYNIEDCYRCPTSVVSMANALIANNTDRLCKRLNPVNDRGRGVVRISQFNSLQQEVDGVASFIKDCIERGVNAGDILVLAQRSQIGFPIYEKLLIENVPVKSYYRESALNNNLAKERFAFLTLLSNRGDAVSLRWLLGSTSSGKWFAGSYKKLRDYCEGNNLSPYQVLSNLNDRLIKIPGTNKLQQRFIEIKGCLDRLDGIDDVEGQINDLFPEDEDGLKLIRSEAVKVLEVDADISLQDLHSKLISLLARPEEDDEQDKVRIMSLHKSKGLSSPVTIITGCVEGFLPRQPEETLPPNIQEQLLQEQRRLLYVGLTRVKSDLDNDKQGVLILTSSRSMPTRDALQAGVSSRNTRNAWTFQASRFLSELGEDMPTPQCDITLSCEDLFN